eukprot:CAMPEP_0171079794 /NCGR_PEP_ID=MMETSP0766_2-20121228/15477_1 /TAXON_ID=439317 /ORGANISM="Gambierdiscus australes, Strain CAWD 149" /LENGTH=46 /DNA_ID= /DNA_START= /DNA_END= /DNA_ORIENTATION=
MSANETFNAFIRGASVFVHLVLGFGLFFRTLCGGVGPLLVEAALAG